MPEQQIESTTRVYAGKVELQDGNGAHLRYVHSDLAKAMVTSGGATVAHANGRVKIIKLVPQPSLIRVGEPSDGCASSRFVALERLDCGGVTWRHHPRCTYE